MRVVVQKCLESSVSVDGTISYESDETLISLDNAGEENPPVKSYRSLFKGYAM